MFDDLFNADTLILFVVAGALAVWALAKMLEQVQKWKKEKWYAAVECLEAGVEQTYETYVKTLKKHAADGKLTDKERHDAREKAIAAAIEFGKTRGIKVIKRLTREYLPVLIKKIVRDRKGNGAA